ncbi:U3 small nucleolar RNA-associated protein 19 [Fasciola gigantica]|uniref:U3 small nucleolar RNA-associated protein 19 n=1 Tax=Fasciola gigantica TaxID=46835 RepID=A0A504YS79_FASGI|nr:U3 small nucleolar RNA-associated protein 19 [Fasciola gigantica]
MGSITGKHVLVVLHCRRNDPEVVKRRFIAVSVICFGVLLHICFFVHKTGCSLIDPSAYELNKAFIRHDNVVISVLFPSLLTVVLYLGPIIDAVCISKTGFRFSLSNQGWIVARNLVVAPLAEEFVFRAAIMFHMQSIFHSCQTLCLVSPLFFSLAHFHHVYGEIKHGKSFQSAISNAVFQVCYTTLFGIYSGFLMLRTGKSAGGVFELWIRIHCNYSRFPMDEIKRLEGNVTFESLRPPVFYENSLLLMQLCLNPKVRMEDALGQPIQRKLFNEFYLPDFHRATVSSNLFGSSNSLFFCFTSLAKTNLFRYTRFSNLKHEFTQVWLRFFEAHVPDRQMIKAVQVLGDGVLHRLSEIRLLADYVIPIFDPFESVENSPSIPTTWSRAVTRTVIGLIHRGGLNYPRLYPRLYELLDESLFICSEVERFLVDLDTCLSSLHLAAHIVAAFLKRLSQLALISPLRLTPAFLLLVRNGLKRHTNCSLLVHRRKRHHPKFENSQTEDGEAVSQHTLICRDVRVHCRFFGSLNSSFFLILHFPPMDSDFRFERTRNLVPSVVPWQSIGDPYQWDPKNLTSSGAVESSLWEVASLQHHYAFEVARLAHQICHPKPNDPVDSTTPGELINAQDKLIVESSKTVRSCLRMLTQSNSEFPQLDNMVGWVDDLDPDTVS